MERQLDPLNVQLSNLEAYRSQLSGGPSTKNSSIYAIRSFYKWCVRHQHLAVSPAAELSAFIMPVKNDEIPTLDNVNSLLEQTKHPWKMLIAIQAMSGARVDGAINLRISDIDWENQKIALRDPFLED